jgi:hypothetical protein
MAAFRVVLGCLVTLLRAKEGHFSEKKIKSKGFIGAKPKTDEKNVRRQRRGRGQVLSVDERGDRKDKEREERWVMVCKSGDGKV